MGQDFIEAVLIAAAAILVAAPFVAARRRRGDRPRAIVVGAAWLLLSAILFVGMTGLRSPRVPEADVPNRPVEDPEAGYVTSKACESCHPREYATWHTSYHRTMTQVATPETALGDFDDVELAYRGRTYRLTTEDGALFVELDTPRWRGPGPPPRVKRRVVLSTGSHHDQNYWFESGLDGRGLALLPFDWSRREGRWVPFQSTFILPPDGPENDQIGLWNQSCIQCHTTRGRNRVVPATDRPGFALDTTVSEFGIACEACHGPAEAHVERYRNPLRRFARHLFGSAPGDDLIVDPEHLDAERASQVCGSCHGISFPRPSATPPVARGEWPVHPWQPGDDIHESRIYVQHRFLDPDLETDDAEKHRFILDLENVQLDYADHYFWPDGMVRVSGRDFTGLMEAPCYQGGEFSCLSCHQLHQSSADPRPVEEWANDMLQADKQDNRACTGCHTGFDTEAALVAHTRHEVGSTGSLCYNCHMPYTVYGIQKAIRSHHIDSPDVRVSVETGRPNACNQCHLDQTLGWAAERLEAWYGTPRPALSDDQENVAASLLWALEGRAGQRALMAWSFGWEAAREASGSAWMAPYLATLLADPYDAVRFVAYQSLKTHAGFEDFDYDYVLRGDAQGEAVARARALTDSDPTFADGTARPRILYDAGGRVSQDDLLRHAARRDDTPEMLSE